MLLRPAIRLEVSESRVRTVAKAKHFNSYLVLRHMVQEKTRSLYFESGGESERLSCEVSYSLLVNL
jgi:hypothetical protein